MTESEARRFVEEAERQQLANIDREKLAEALRVLTEATKGPISENEILIRARALAQRINLLPSIGPAPTIDPQTGEELDLPPLDPTFTRRFYDAASELGIPESQVHQMVASAQQQSATAGGELSPEFLLQGQLDQWEAEIQARRGSPIGVPDDFVAQRTVIHGPGDIGMGGPGSFVRPVEPRYFEGDEFSPAGLDPAQITQIQQRLVDAGLMEPDTYWAGFWDSQTAGAYKQALGMANQSGLDVDKALEELARTLPESIKEQRAQAEAAKVFQEPPFVEPDYATLAQDAKSYFRSRVGRDPTEAEMAEWTGVMSNLYRQDFEAEVAEMRAQFEAAQDPTKTAEPTTIQGVDPVARFRQMFDQRFGSEINRLESLDDVRANASNVFASLRTMSSLIGGR